MQAVIAIGCGDDDDALVMDFFAGSGTLADAAIQRNVSHGSSLRYLLVQLPETSETSQPRELSSITRERMRRVRQDAENAAATLKFNGEHVVDLGFRAYKLVASNFAVWSATTTSEADLAEQLKLSVEHVVPGSTEESMLSEILLKAGFALTSASEIVEFAGIRGQSIADGALLVCLSKALSIEAFEAMVDRQPAMIVVSDAGFGGSDELKVNALQTVRSRNRQSGSDIALRVV